MGLSELELADRSGCSPETVRRFVDLGVLGRGAEVQLANTALFSPFASSSRPRRDDSASAPRSAPR
jgi:hypothetical protein